MLEETWGRWSHHFHNQEVAIINAGSPFIFFHFLLFFIHSVTSARAIMLPIFRVINLIQLNISRLSLTNTVRGEYLRQFWIPTSWQPNYHFNIDSWSICVSSIYIFIICLSFIFLSSFLSSSFFLFFFLSFARSVFFFMHLFSVSRHLFAYLSLCHPGLSFYWSWHTKGSKYLCD